MKNIRSTEKKVWHVIDIMQAFIIRLFRKTRTNPDANTKFLTGCPGGRRSIDVKNCFTHNSIASYFAHEMLRL